MATVQAGTVVGGKYRLEEPIGEGGMASVWRATHTTLESDVAVKFLDLMGITGRDTMKERFLREAKLAANLKHRNVVHILDFGVLEASDQPFMVMELLEGESLGDRFESEEDLDEVAMMDVFTELLGGLAAVHDAGIVHRDVKPDNVFLVVDADGEYPKLLDFGVSRSRGSSRVTAANTVVGTPAYMSPEQALGEDDLDHRSDLFGVGVMLYEFFAGLIPFETGSPSETMIRVATEDMPPLSEYRPDLPVEVQRLVDCAVRRQREERFENARAMREALSNAIEALSDAPRRGTKRSRRREVARAETVVTESPSVEAPGASSPPPSSTRLWVLGAVVVSALVLGVAVATSWSDGPTTATSSILDSAAEPVEGAEAQAVDPPDEGSEAAETIAAEPSLAEGSQETAQPEEGPGVGAETDTELARQPSPATQDPARSPPPPQALASADPPATPDPPPATEPEPTPEPEASVPTVVLRPDREPRRPVRPPEPTDPEPSGGFLRELDY